MAVALTLLEDVRWRGEVVVGATIRLQSGTKQIGTAQSDGQGRYSFANVATGDYSVSAEASGFVRIARTLHFPDVNSTGDLQFREISALTQSLVISAKSLEPEVDLRNSEVFDKTLFARDDQASADCRVHSRSAKQEVQGEGVTR